MRRACPLLLLLSACASSQVVGGHCSYKEFHGTCRFVALERGATGQAWAFYDFDGRSQFGVAFSIDDDHLAAFEAHLRAHRALPCAGKRFVAGMCALGNVEIPSFDAATPVQ